MDYISLLFYVCFYTYKGKRIFYNLIDLFILEKERVGRRVEEKGKEQAVLALSTKPEAGLDLMTMR